MWASACRRRCAPGRAAAPLEVGWSRRSRRSRPRVRCRRARRGRVVNASIRTRAPRRRRRRVDVAAHDPAAAEHVSGIARVQGAVPASAAASALGAVLRCGQRRVADGQVGVGDRRGRWPRRRRGRARPRRESASRRRRGPADRAGRRRSRTRCAARRRPRRRRPARASAPEERRQLAERRSGACGCGERTTRIASMGRAGGDRRGERVGAEALGSPGPWPAHRGGARAPTAAPAGATAAHRSTAPPAHCQHRLDDLAVAGAAAEHPGEHLPAPRPRSAADWRAAAPRRSSACRGCKMPHCAAPWATNARCSGESVPSASGQALDRRHRAPRALSRRRRCTSDLGAVEEDGAGAAVAGVAADLGAVRPSSSRSASARRRTGRQRARGRGR